MLICHCIAAAGWLYQEADSLQPADIDFTVVSETQPTEQQLADLKFAWTAVKHVKVKPADVVRTHSVRLCIKSTVQHANTGMPQSRAEDIVTHCFVVLQSNAITVAKGMRLLGMGSGQPNRVNSVRIALEKAADEAEVPHLRLMPCLLHSSMPSRLPP